MRMRGHSVCSGGTQGSVEYYDGTPESGTLRVLARADDTEGASVDYVIPANGVLFESGIIVKSTVDVGDHLQVYYTG